MSDHDYYQHHRERSAAPPAERLPEFRRLKTVAETSKEEMLAELTALKEELLTEGSKQKELSTREKARQVLMESGGRTLTERDLAMYKARLKMQRKRKEEEERAREERASELITGSE